MKLSTIQKNNFIFKINLLNEYILRSENLSEIEITFIKRELYSLLDILPISPEIIRDFGQPVERLVINESILNKNSRLKNISEVKYPPKEYERNLNYNRCSLKGQSIMYVGAMGILANSIEVQPESGQLSSISKWKHKVGVLFNLLVLCQDKEISENYPNQLLEEYNGYETWLNKLDENTKIVIENIFKLIIKAFTRKVSYQNKQGYLFSALISNYFFYHSNVTVDAIYYPSVPNTGWAMNLAIKPDVFDLKFELMEITESVCCKHGNNQWMNIATATSVGYDKLGNLIWKSVPITDDYPTNEYSLKKMIQYYDIKFE